MSTRPSFTRPLVIFIVLLIMVLFPPGVAKAQVIMPFNEIRAGDRCYGLTVFQGATPEKFDCGIVDIFNSGSSKYILVLLSGGPKDSNGSEILSQTNIFGGMSGSPVYTQEGKIIGAASITWQFTKKPYALLTPIEMMVGFKPRILDAPNKLIYDYNLALEIFTKSNLNVNAAPSIKAGETYIFCDYWGDSDSCKIGTVTFVNPRDKSIVYALGHQSSNSSGVTALPFWKGQVSAIIPNLAISSKIVRETGPMLGSVIFDGPYGQIVKLGALPKFMPMNITLDNVLQEKLENKYFFAYIPQASTNISKVIIERKNVVDKLLDVDAEIWVNIAGLRPIFSSGVIGETTVTGAIVNNFLGDQLDPVVEGIKVTLKARPKYKILSLKKVTASPVITIKGEEFVDVSVVTDNVGEQELINTVRIKVDKNFIDKHLQIADGERVAEDILSQNSSPDVRAEIVDLLNKVSDRNSLYVYYVEAEEGEPIKNKDILPTITISLGEDLAVNKSALTVDTKKLSAEVAKEPLHGWRFQSHKSTTQILAKIDFPNKGIINSDVIIKGKKDFLVKSNSASNTESLKKKNKFWLF